MDSYGYEFDKEKVWDANYSFIHSFEEIGWPYPVFEKEKWLQEQKDEYESPQYTIVNKDGEEQSIIYPKEKFNPEFTPLCTYIPTNKLLIQMMRTAIYVEDTNDLLYNYSIMIPDFSSFGDESNNDQKSN